MSLYRFARTSALLAFAGRYRLKIFYMVAAAAFALVTSWLYGDVAAYLAAHYPQWIGIALIAKTVIVYAALFFLLWQVEPSEWRAQQNDPAVSSVQSEMSDSKLDQIAQKEKLSTRKDSILSK